MTTDSINQREEILGKPEPSFALDGMAPSGQSKTRVASLFC